MKPVLLTFLFIGIYIVCHSQIIDAFSDDNFSENPTWLGDDSLFIINTDKQLQLNAKSAGNACLSVNYIKNDVMEWRFWIKEKFSPSTNNFCDVYLYSDKQDLKTANLAYILRFGESGSDDVVELLQLKNNELKSLCRGIDTFIASSFSTFVKIIYDKSNTWRIYFDKEDDAFFKLETEGFDDDFYAFANNAYFGFDCTYTNSNIKQFYFDDIYIGEKIIDSVAPELSNYEIIDDYHIELKFSEPIDESSLNLSNYIIDNQTIKLNDANYGDSYSTIILEFEAAIPEETKLTLTIENVKDLEGNICERINLAFIYYKPRSYDIVINEIMADPSPSIGLAEREYIELYNATDFPINMKKWTLLIGNTEYVIDKDIDIQSDEYLILCHEESVEELSNYGRCIGFGSLQITNSGTNIILLDKNDYLISSVNFDISWHSVKYKEDGGWSLEQIDPHNPCAGKHNWRSSESKIGGTPGNINSINNTNILIPDLDYINPLSRNTIEVHFNQNMNEESLQIIDNYLIKEMQIKPEEILMPTNEKDMVQLIFNREFEEGNLYTLNINNVRNCKDVSTDEMIEVTFGVSLPLDSNDVIINEILFNPIMPGVEYVELYNRSEKVIDLSEIMIGTIKENFPNPPDTIVKAICSEGRILLPHNYVLLSTDSEIVEYQYNVKNNKNFIDIESFPSLSNEEGQVVICRKNRSIIDKVYYSEKMHYDLLIETQGVSLERISFEKSSLDKDNWHSASYDVNYGTPGYRNSMAFEHDIASNQERISIIPEIFSPDGDGFDDTCVIYYKDGEKAKSVNMKIFNSKGILIRNLLYNSLIGDEISMIWDACDENNRRVEAGIYIVQVEVFDLEGNVERMRSCVVVATK